MSQYLDDILMSSCADLCDRFDFIHEIIFRNWSKRSYQFSCKSLRCQMENRMKEQDTLSPAISRNFVSAQRKETGTS